MAVTLTDIANFALDLINIDNIDDINLASSKAARKCKQQIFQTIEEVGRSHEWNCLKTRTQLSTQTSTPVGDEWSYQFTYPSQCIRLITVMDSYGYEKAYEVNGGLILSNEEILYATYIKNETNTARYDSLFIRAVYTLLASKISRALGVTDGLDQKLLQEYEQIILPRAKLIDMRERRKAKINYANQSPLINSRLYSTNG